MILNGRRADAGRQKDRKERETVVPAALSGCRWEVYMEKLQIEKLVLGMVATNCYLAKNKETGAVLIVDPADCADRIIAKVNAMGGQPEAVLLTHGHFDHIGAARELHEHYNIPVCAYKDEKEIMENVDKNLSLMTDVGFTAEADRLFADGETVKLAGFDVKILHTPGHTLGSCCYYIEQEQVLFSGDTLFRCSVGRTDFPTGSMSQIHNSIHSKLFVLPEETMVYPGHDQMTDIAYEKRYNPY